MPQPFWNYYIAVDSVAAAADRAITRGGQVAERPDGGPRRRLDRAGPRPPGRPLRDGERKEVTDGGTPDAASPGAPPARCKE